MRDLASYPADKQPAYGADPEATLKADMKWFYENRLVKSRPGRLLYAAISEPAGDRCPLCEISIVETLDHSLPKAKFPRLAVSPANLVPCCYSCNLGMGASITGTISPYFDDWAVRLGWLHAFVRDETNPGTLTFNVRRHPSWSIPEWLALRGWFRAGKVGRRYAVLAAAEFDSFRILAGELHRRGGMPSVLDDLHSRHHPASSPTANDWRMTAYAAWIKAAHRIDWGVSANWPSNPGSTSTTLPVGST